MERCPACDPQATGYCVAFASAHERDAVEATLRLAAGEDFQIVDERTFWLKDRSLFDHIDYWGDHLNPVDWSFSSAALAMDGTIVGQPGVLTWDEVVTRRPVHWVNDIVSQGRLRMMFQPIVDARGRDHPIGFEMLARGLDEAGGVIPPSDLFQAARDQNQLFRLDKACRLQGIEAAARLLPDQLVFLNFIPTSIYVPEHCLRATMEAVTRIGLRPEQVVFEVVETERVHDLNHLRRILEYYRARGFRYALDDVGEGFNQLGVLQELKPDVVKLDRQFVSRIDQNQENRDVAREVLDICARIGATPLAEGVEREEEAKLLWELGFVWQQGYYYGRPGWDPVPHSPRPGQSM